VFENPAQHWSFITQARDTDFEGQHFDRKIAGQNGADSQALQRQLRDVRDEITETVSAFANRNVEGGLLILGVSSDGSIEGIDHL